MDIEQDDDTQGDVPTSEEMNGKYQLSIGNCHNPFPISNIISPVYKSIVNNLHSRMDIEWDDDTQGDVLTPEEMKGNLLPDGPYPLIMESALNYFDSSPQGWLSHSQPKKRCCCKKNI